MSISRSLRLSSDTDTHEDLLIQLKEFVLQPSSTSPYARTESTPLQQYSSP